MTNIVFASDEGFVPQLTVAVASAVWALCPGGEGMVVHVLDCGITDRAWGRFHRKMGEVSLKAGVNANVVRHAVDLGLFSGLPGWTNGSRATWARILLPEILEDVPCCIYSDCDMLFLEDPAEILSELKSSGLAILGHRNPFGDAGPDARWFKEHGLPFDVKDYFCAGLIGMDLDWMRKNGTVSACWDFLRRFPNPVSMDQTVLNCVCAGHKGLLPDGWGVFTHECFTDGTRLKALHFSGGWPWAKAKNVYDAVCIRLSRPASELWRLFQREVLGLEPSASSVPNAFHAAVAMCVLALCRTLCATGIRLRRIECLLELVRSYGGPLCDIERAKSRMLRRG